MAEVNSYTLRAAYQEPSGRLFGWAGASYWNFAISDFLTKDSGGNYDITTALLLNGATFASGDAATKNIYAGTTELNILTADGSARIASFSNFGASTLFGTLNVGHSVGVGSTLGGWASSGTVSLKNVTGLGNTLSLECTGTAGSACITRIVDTGASLHEFYYSLSSSLVGTIRTNGTTTSYNTTSDRRVKKNITDTDTDPGPLIDRIRIREYDMRFDDTHIEFGVIVQELAEDVPELEKFGVFSPGDGKKLNADGTIPTVKKMVEVGRDDDGKPVIEERDVLKDVRLGAVDPSKMVWILVREIQLLRARVAALESA